MSKISFVNKVRSQSKESLYLVKGIDRGISCWYYVDVPKVSDALFNRSAVIGQNYDLNTYGKIIVSGWGTEPHEHVVKQIEASGSAYNPNTDQEWQNIINEKTNIYFVQAKDSSGKDFHAYVAVNGALADKFIEDTIKGNINVYNYGEVVLIDWGYPTEETKRHMTEKYGVDHAHIDSILASAD